MPKIELLDTLIRLASLGTSGICIFAIFWIGWLLSKPPAPHSALREKSLRIFMSMCLGVALISLATAIVGQVWDNSSLREQLTSAEEKLKARDQLYTVLGTVELGDGGDPRTVTITTSYPPLTPYNKQGLFQFDVCKEPTGRFPALSITCPGYELRPVNLNDELVARTTKGRVEISKVVLNKLP